MIIVCVCMCSKQVKLNFDNITIIDNIERIQIFHLFRVELLNWARKIQVIQKSYILKSNHKK